MACITLRSKPDINLTIEDLTKIVATCIEFEDDEIIFDSIEDFVPQTGFVYNFNARPNVIINGADILYITYQ